MTFFRTLILMALAATLLTGCADSTPYPPLPTVAHVELERYSGRWYEIARYPHSFEEGCTNVTADYILQDSGIIGVINRCTQPHKDGKVKSAAGRAKVVDPVTNARLKVSFFRPFYGDYWILYLDPDYQHAIVGTPSRKYLWILSRTPGMESSLLQQLIAETARLGFDPGRLIMTEQSGLTD